mmetsp:Transcript_20346/g.61295  ORF Transcript_20346/g.61295 Transcript_20346/m.61295 type:complete len:460 (-) Transcript_20346:1178-2557(-)|eukprot:CAMPEP_0206138716 /NCGR_PEP_ID=MMETSP1473-20131121/3514_1 /ASSEMBLY_ACC=CAM_ASM_001109 /TAXON_ID=1461547 /ORGANISM="Stichococcus sp, Strain RCC1054" /LENGTH=459 /DNA_ID=CAMNT_0053532223 /DNA_START=278 /DNA_END=1657 /DNA_ORIENTATION=-
MDQPLMSSSDDDSRPASISGLGLLLAREDAPLNPQAAGAILSFTSRSQWSPVMAPDTGLLIPSDSDTDSEEPPFLHNRIGANEVEYYIGSGSKFTYGHLAKEVRKQAWLSAPLAADLVMTHSLTLVSLAWAAQLGTLPLAVAALGAACYTMLGRLIISGICGALDTQAAQAFGGGDMDALPTITQRAVLFSLLHCAPITGVLIAAPSIMQRVGVEPVLCTLVFPYICILIPRLWIEALNRPLYGCLLAQRIALPQMCITALVITLHVFLCYELIFGMELGLSGAALATTISSCINFILTLVFVLSRGLQARTWGRPSTAALKGWRRFARLAYASCAMKVLEAWSAGVTILLAALLPQPERSVASITVASDLYTVLSMPFLAGGMAACVRVGAALGAGQASGAQLAARASLLAVPALWLLLAVLLLEPHSQSLVLWLFTKVAPRRQRGTPVQQHILQGTN